jgi:inhibitor of cysteine peptidase
MSKMLALVVPALLSIVLSVASACSPPRETRAISLGAEDAGRRIELSKGHTLDVSLASNPTTGYRWEAKDLDEEILRQIGEPEFEPQSKLVGAPGVEVLRFQAVDAGRTTLNLVYRRSWETDVEPLETYSVEVLVR